MAGLPDQIHAAARHQVCCMPGKRKWIIGSIKRDVLSYEKVPLDIQKINPIESTTGNQYLTARSICKYSTSVQDMNAVWKPVADLISHLRLEKNNLTGHGPWPCPVKSLNMPSPAPSHSDRSSF